ncbi:uncharacterized protein [Leptinotarsa decemlineata]|uniref:uncharacterized protein n=1 Tax=Leptinotarsa decemlineata TaxID=7539 RepID=UPI000C253CF9|nr:uncharacterized protein LOC111507877 [Leptinotarsa decemlineata]
MFLLKKSDRIIQNSLRHYNKIIPRKTNPGIQRRRNILAHDLDAKEEEDLDFEGLESDFMSVHQTHRAHVEEMERMEEQKKYFIVRQKYFNEKKMNFLTWHDKEQMKYLYATDPEKWTIEKLSESFPALPDTVIKIVEANFKKSESKIANHDAAVQRNWESFKKGEFPDLPKDLVEHLNKFSNRALTFKRFIKPTNKNEITVTKQSSPSDFSEIITSYKKLKNKNKEIESEVEITMEEPKKFLKASHVDTFLTVPKNEMKDRRDVTLSQLQDNIEQKALKGSQLSEDEKLILNDFKEPKEQVVAPLMYQEDSFALQNKYNTESGGAIATKTVRDYSHLIYPEKIQIPSDKVKRGYTYRLNDCYYDYDGEFLYRVPGMG